MNIPKEYILMCVKAKKIQEMWIPEIGDYILVDIYKKTSIFIPRQDQLQKMCKIDYQVVWLKNNKIEFHYGDEQQEIVDSVEQGLLNAVMNEKYNKVWNGTNWVKEIK